MKEFAGILFTLKKRGQSISEDDSRLYKYTVLGYYDGLDVHTVDKWYDLRPKGLLDRNLQVDLKSPFIDQYTIRALMPSNRDELDNIGFSYNFWEQAGMREPDKYQEYESDLREHYPFISMSVINLTEEFVKTMVDLQTIQTKVIECLIAAVNNSGYNLSELHCAIFPSIGYSDFIIIFHTDDLVKSANIISQIRGAVIENKDTKETVMVTSNCYSVCALDKSYFSNTGNDLGKNLRISIRINLKGGISAKDFLDFLCAEVKENYNGEDDIELFLLEVEKNYYVTFGNSDCLFLPEQPLERYLKWYGPNQILNPGSPFFKQYISNVRTSIRVDIKQCIHTGNNPKFNVKDLSKYEKEFGDFVNTYDEFLKKNNMHIRSSRAIRQIMRNFINIAQSSHSFDTEHIIGAAFSALLKDALYYINKEPKEITSDLTSDELEEIYNYNEYINEEKKCVVEVVEMFKEYIGSFLSDLMRSDRPFIEGNTLTHPSIGSATKLLFAYSAMLEDLTKRYNKENEFIYIVLSGGCDRTEAIDLFAFVHENENIKKPVIIRIPEMSLYDIQGTLFRILHEYMHYIGDRRRKERYHCLVNALANYIAWEMVELEFGDKRLQELYYHATFNLSDDIDLSNTVKKTIEDLFLQMKEYTKEQIASAIKSHPYFEEYGKSEKEEDYFASTLTSGILNLYNIVNVFNIKEKDFSSASEDCLQKVIYYILYNSDKNLVQSIINFLENIISKNKDFREDMLLRIPIQKYKFLKQNYIFRDANPKAYDKKLIKFIEQYFSSLIQNIPLINGGKENFKAEFSFTEILFNILYSMKECFSDCAAIKIIDMSVEDFLLSFIYELWEIDKAFPLSSENILRLGADLKVMYGIEKNLPFDIRTSVSEKVNKRLTQGYEYRNVEEMLDRIDVILKQYQFEELDGVRSELESYLMICFKRKEDWYYDKLGQLYKLCNINTSMDIYEVIDAIICDWKNLGDRR